eukprot:jgi/Chrzof1/12295/Cz06g29070.t1
MSDAPFCQPDLSLVATCHPCLHVLPVICYTKSSKQTRASFQVRIEPTINVELQNPLHRQAADQYANSK